MTINNPTTDNPILWTALITPFDTDGNIDFSAVKHLALQQQNANNGILLLGSTGEGLALTLAEKKQLVQFVCELNLSVPIMVAVGGFQLASQIEWIELCNSLPIHSYLLASPLYAKPGVEGQTQWFQALLDAAQFPCMLYNIPSRSGVAIPIETVQRLQHHQHCWAIKEASGDINQFLAFRQACPEVELYSGEDGLMPYLATAGAKGLVSVCSNVWPEQTHLYVEMALAGRETELFPTWNNAVASLFAVANPIPVKILAKLQNNIACDYLRPPLTATELADHQHLLEADSAINNWFSSNLSAPQIKAI